MKDVQDMTGTPGDLALRAVSPSTQLSRGHPQLETLNPTAPSVVVLASAPAAARSLGMGKILNCGLNPENRCWMVNNITLNFDALHGHEDHGVVHDRTTIVFYKWFKKSQEPEVEDCSLLLIRVLTEGTGTRVHDATPALVD